MDPLSIAGLVLSIVQGLLKLAPDVRRTIADVLRKDNPTKEDLDKIREVVERPYEYYDPDPPSSSSSSGPSS